jgi:hypothetical protein
MLEIRKSKPLDVFIISNTYVFVKLLVLISNQSNTYFSFVKLQKITVLKFGFVGIKTLVIKFLNFRTSKERPQLNKRYINHFKKNRVKGL